jgi:tyrosine-specific transport protein
MLRSRRNTPLPRGLVSLLTFGPPLMVALFYPGLFLKMLNLVGGLGIMLLFGLLPGVILLTWKQDNKKSRRFAALLLCFVFLLLIALECAQEIGLLQIHPQVEYWQHQK